MGKRRRLNRFITKWIRSDLPSDEHSTVLLLGVTRIPTSPVPARRPCSLPLTNPFPYPNHHHHNHRQPPSWQQQPPPPQQPQQPQQRCTTTTNTAPTYDTDSYHNNAAVVTNIPHATCSSGGDSTNNTPLSISSSTSSTTTSTSSSTTTTNTTNNHMDRSVDSIGTCSLDVDVSVDLTEWSENSSTGTLRSVSLKSPQQPTTTVSNDIRLPSYLSLACTVNGYSTITNYDPERLAKSRDSSPHRYTTSENNAPDNHLTYAIHNNLLSPPNLVPLPPLNLHHNNKKTKNNKHEMAEQITTQHRHQEFYTKSSTFTTSFITNGKDAVDACLETSKYHHRNGQTPKYVSEETKSFIQQRVERLYGPGALAQGFFVTKRQQSRSFNIDSKHETSATFEHHQHSKSMLEGDAADTYMRQSASSPALPVLRHLTPEFRAQLPIMSPRKGGCGGTGPDSSSLSKSSTVPVLKDEVNGHASQNNNNNNNVIVVAKTNGCRPPKNEVNLIKDDKEVESSDVKDGHYFLNVLETETQRLLALADKAEEELHKEGLSEDAKGFLRSASGKAKLLVSQKMQQFKGLCTNNITQNDGDEFPTTNEDLQGFWDMVMLQVDQVDALFKELDVLRANNWIEVKSGDVPDKATTLNQSGGRFVRKAMPARAKSAGAEEARKKREAQRKQMLEDRRKAMRQQNQVPRQSIEIFVPESS